MMCVCVCIYVVYCRYKGSLSCLMTALPLEKHAWVEPMWYPGVVSLYQD